MAWKTRGSQAPGSKQGRRERRVVVEDWDMVLPVYWRELGLSWIVGLDGDRMGCELGEKEDAGS